MNKWNTVPFKTLYSEPSRNGLMRPKAVRGKGYKMINMGEIFAFNRFKNPPMDLVLLNTLEKSKYTVNAGDLLFARQSLVAEGAGKCSIVLEVPETTTFESHLIRVRLNKNKADPLYFYYYFTSPIGKGNVQSLVIQVAAAGIRASELAELQVPDPPLPTQRKIAAILSAYDDLIENNTRRIAILEEMAQSIYQEWFVHFRYPGHEKNKMVESDLGMIPERWNTAKFIEIADVLSGGTPRTANQEYWHGQIPFFAPRDAKSSFYILETEQHITELGLKSCNSKLYPRNTVFITARGTVGKVLLNAVDMAMNQSCYALRGKDGIRQYFVFMAIKNCINQLKAQATGAVFDTITVDTFRTLEILKPPITLTEEFSDFVDPIFQQILNLLKRNRILRQTRDILLPKLISGEIDVEALDIDIPKIAEVEEPQETPIATPPEPINATQLALFAH